MLQHFARVAQLDNLARIHDGDPIGDRFDGAQVVGHEHVGAPEPRLQVGEQLNHSTADRGIERGHGLVKQQQLAAACLPTARQRGSVVARRARHCASHGAGQRTRDSDTLALPAGQLVRVARALRGAQPDALQ